MPYAAESVPQKNFRASEQLAALMPQLIEPIKGTSFLSLPRGPDSGPSWSETLLKC
jgi:hypothetical protein